MSKKLIIAEKPSVAGDIAKALGGFTRHGDYYEPDPAHALRVASRPQFQNRAVASVS